MKPYSGLLKEFLLTLKSVNDKRISNHAYSDVYMFGWGENQNKRRPRKSDLICENTNLSSFVLSHFIDVL